MARGLVVLGSTERPLSCNWVLFVTAFTVAAIAYSDLVGLLDSCVLTKFQVLDFFFFIAVSPAPNAQDTECSVKPF